MKGQCPMLHISDNVSPYTSGKSITWSACGNGEGKKSKNYISTECDFNTSFWDMNESVKAIETIMINNEE